MDLINKCIENAKQRIDNPKNKMNAYSYISYFVKRNDLTIENDLYIREQISKYLDKNIKVEFTVNGKKYRKV